MKKILFRKLLLDCFIFFIITLLSTAIIIWIFQAVNFLDIMIEDGRDYIVYVNYTLLNFPKIISKILPFALFFSFSYVLAKYENNNELIVFWNYGVDKIQLINFFIKFSIIIMVIQIILSTLIVPKTQDLARSFLRTSSVDFFDSFIKPKKFNDTIKNLTIYAESKDDNGNLKNIYIKKSNKSGTQITFSKTGEFVQKNGTKVLVLYNGQTINENNNNISNFSFSESDFSFINLKSNTTTTIKTQETSTLELINCIKDLNTLKKKSKENLISNLNSQNCSSRNLNNIYTELYKRVIIPLYIPLLIIISLLHIIKSKETINYYKYRIILFTIGLTIIILSESSLKMIEDNFLSNIKLIIFPFLSVIFIYLSLLYQLKLKFKYRKF
jgi:lipopolysaccharide export system permease protein